jgi:hypothetical protein
MPEVNTDDCKDIEEYYARQRAREFAGRFYREHGLPKARLYCAVLNRSSKLQRGGKSGGLERYDEGRSILQVHRVINFDDDFSYFLNAFCSDY